MISNYKYIFIFFKRNIYWNFCLHIQIFFFQVKVTKKEESDKEEKFIRNLHKGDFFGEKALQGYIFFVCLFTFIVSCLFTKWFFCHLFFQRGKKDCQYHLRWWKWSYLFGKNFFLNTFFREITIIFFSIFLKTGHWSRFLQSNDCQFGRYQN